MFEFSAQQSQMMLLGGIILMGWTLIRRQIRAKHRQHQQDRSSSNVAAQLYRTGTSEGVPLASAPPDTQRWQVEMLQLQRELKAELDMKIAVVQSLLRQADEKIDQLNTIKHQ
jgi:hypothetical protein